MGFWLACILIAMEAVLPQGTIVMLFMDRMEPPEGGRRDTLVENREGYRRLVLDYPALCAIEEAIEFAPQQPLFSGSCLEVVTLISFHLSSRHKFETLRGHLLGLAPS